MWEDFGEITRFYEEHGGGGGGGGGREAAIDVSLQGGGGGGGGITRYIGSVLGLGVNSLPNGPFKSNIYVYFDSSSEV